MVGDQTPVMDGDLQERARQLSLQRQRPPDDVPGYEPERFLGRGAFGEVWLAVDRNSGRRVAIKFYNRAGGTDFSQLLREVDKLRFLFTDRHVVQLLEVGWEANPPHYVMEYLESGSLEDLLAERTLSVPDALALFREVAVGLVHAHGKGILHCDLKPANVLLDQYGKPRLADFGQSRLTHETSPALGTLYYMAPEQADPQAVPDARWDVYALGALLYRMLTGHPPYRSHKAAAEIQGATRLEDRLARYRQLLRDAPRSKEHRRVRGVDRSLAAIIERCLEVDPRRRFANVQAVLDALNARALRRGRRPLLVLGAIGPALFLLIMALGAWFLFDAAITSSRETLIRRVRESNAFAARFVAETVARQVNRRWIVLEREAADPSLRALLRRLVGGPDPAAREKLQAWIESRRTKYQDGPLADFWFVNSGRGIQLARSPFSPRTILQDYSFRDYFHGRGKDLPPGTTDMRPIREPHLSVVYMNKASGQWTVAFTVPIWSRPPEEPGAEVLGVLGMSIAAGHFAELRSITQVVAMVDSRSDETGKKGLILQHPHLSLGLEAADVAAFRWGPEKVALLEALARKARGELLTAEETRTLQKEYQSLAEDYVDPIGGDYDGRWLAEVEPVVIKTSEGQKRESGWSVVVQERHAKAVAPVLELQRRLADLGLFLLAMVASVVAGLWGLVYLLHNESPLARLQAFLRRRAGLSTGSAASTGGSSPEGPPSEGKAEEAAPPPSAEPVSESVRPPPSRGMSAPV